MITICGKQVPVSLTEIVDRRHAALLIIDMQNDFCAPGGSFDRAGADLKMLKDITPRIARFAQTCRDQDVPVIHTKMLSLPDGRSDSVAWLRLKLRAARNYAGATDGAIEHTIVGTWGAEFVEGLEPKDGDLTVEKYRSSALHKTVLDQLLRSNQIRNVLVAGCATEGCVESTVRDLTFYDYIPVVLADCVGSDQRQLHDASLALMSAERADVATAAEVKEVWLASQLGSEL